MKASGAQSPILDQERAQTGSRNFKASLLAGEAGPDYNDSILMAHNKDVLLNLD
jgi:hypothetical protein